MYQDQHQREYALQRANAERRVPRYRSILLSWMLRALTRPRPVKPGPEPVVHPGQVAVRFAGHSSFVLRYHNTMLACDPMLSGWCNGVRRAVAPGLSPRDFVNARVILITHDRADHMDLATLSKMPRAATVIVPSRAAHKLSKVGFARVIELGVGQFMELDGLGIHAVGVKHHRDAPALSYVIRGQGPTVYSCGDSGYHDGFTDIGRQFRPDIVLLPIGGYSPPPFRAHHMSPIDAIYAFEDLGARISIPHHYGTFQLSYERLEDPGRWLAQLVRERGLDNHVVALAPGESRVFARPGRSSSHQRPGSPGYGPGAGPGPGPRFGPGAHSGI